jgi:thiamine-monophosphate kinase
MGERALIRTFRKHAPTHPWLTIGPGQDCAALRWDGRRELVFKIDQVQEGTHFLLKGKERATPYQVGWKAMAKTCSDIAAAGCWPVAAMVAVNLKKGTDEKIALELYRGITACCRKYRFALAGGDLSASKNGLSVVVSLIGEGPRGAAWTRAGAKPGDLLYVTGTLGGSRAHKHLDFAPRLDEARAIRAALGKNVHACIDITDGLSRDLHHLCEESGVGAVIWERLVPLSAAARRDAHPFARALSDGEDFELLLAVSPRARAKMERLKLRCGMTLIGCVARGTSAHVYTREKRFVKLSDVGYEHGTQ